MRARACSQLPTAASDIYVAMVRTANGKPYKPTAPGAPPPTGPFKFGYINLDGHYVIAPKFDGGMAFRDGLAAVESGGKWGYVDFDGKTVIPPQFSAGGFFAENLAAEPGEGGKFGYIDKQGKFTIPASFDEARPFSEGFAAVRMVGFRRSRRVGKAERLRLHAKGVGGGSALRITSGNGDRYCRRGA